MEAASLTTGAVSTLLELGAGQFPMTMAYVDGARAALTIQDDAYANHTFLWNPSSTALGSELPYALDALGTDGKGNLVGAHSTLTNNDAGIDIVSLPFADGGVDAASIQTLGSNPFTQNEGFLNGADLWPHP